MKAEEVELRGELAWLQERIARFEQERENKKTKAWSEFIEQGGVGPVPDW